jgi:hypothetical protein
MRVSDLTKKTLITKAVVMLPVLAALTACIPSPEDLETTPVQVNTPQGVVTCQLYRHDRVTWDRAIDFPATKMSVKQADAYCRQEGQRRLK